MNRKYFIKTCGLACVGATVMPPLLQGCSSTKTLSGVIEGDNIVVPISFFAAEKNKQPAFKKYVVIQHERLLFPICVYRFDERTYSAVWMRCTHQGTELQVFGDKLECPAHGSEFSNRGAVENGPADTALRSFAIIIEDNRLKISLKKV